MKGVCMGQTRNENRNAYYRYYALISKGKVRHKAEWYKD